LITPIEEAAGRQAQDRHGYGVETAKDADKALIAFQRRSFDVLVSDITMPRVSGIDLLHRIRADCNDIPVVLVTGDPHIDTAIAAMEHGAVRYIAKPVEPGELVRAEGQAVWLQKIARANRLALDNEARETLIQELKRVKNAAEASSRTKGELLAKMSHELRTSVDAIIGTTDRAHDTELTLEQRKYLTTGIASAASLLGIVQHVLDASALD
jgi:hypothetical protein